MPLEPLVPDVPAVDPGAPVTRDLHAMPVRVGSAAEENAVAPVMREADELHEPPDGQPLQVDGRVLAAGAAGVRHRRREGRQHAQLGCRRVHEGGEAGVILAAPVRQHALVEEFQDLLGRDSLGSEAPFPRSAAAPHREAADTPDSPAVPRGRPPWCPRAGDPDPGRPRRPSRTATECRCNPQSDAWTEIASSAEPPSLSQKLNLLVGRIRSPRGRRKAALARGGARPAGTGRKVLLDHLPRHRRVVEPPAAERAPHGNDLVARVGEDLAVVGTYLVPQVDRQLPVEQERSFHFPEQLPCLVDGLEYGLAELGVAARRTRP